ncbi:speedy protein 1-A-like [Xenopus tropicalis]|uniref:Speedy protein 1-A-like n=1 Tax=Xenopus tropicalis TaxID=8364 RepID=A0A8J1JQY5_XENTR|nr:speedy protein 1-A-like [Xenopus tropicalis]
MTETKDKLINSKFDEMLEENNPHVEEAEAEAYFQLLSDKKIMSFLQKDRFYKIADKYLLAIVLIYFKRAGLKIDEFTRQNFVVSLYLAHEIEEDTDIPKMAMLAWVLGKNLKEKRRNFIRKWDRFLQQMDYRAIVSKSECDELMAQHNPSHWAWLRDRSEHHESTDGSSEIPKEDKITSSPSSQCAASVKQLERKRKRTDEETENSPAAKIQKT